MHYYEKLCTLPELKESGYQNRDPLKKINDMVMSPYKNPLLRKFYIFACLVYGYYILMSIYVISYEMDFKTLLRYGPLFGIQLFIMDMLYIIIFIYADVHEFEMRISNKLMAFQLSDGKLLSKITNMANIVKLVLAANSVSVILMSGAGLIACQDYWNENAYNRVWFCQHFSVMSCKIHGYFLSLIDFPVLTAIASLPFILVYYEIVGIAHINYMNEMIKTICDTSLPKKDLYESETFQQIVTQKLKICVMMHQVIIGISNDGKSMIHIPILLVILGSLILGSSLMLFIFGFQLDTASIDSIQFTILVSLVNVAINGWYYIFFSQMVKDESEYSLYLLKQVPWYYMNKRNRQMYLIYLINCENPISLNTYILEVNYVLMVRLFRTMYSIATILIRFRPNL